MVKLKPSNCWGFDVAVCRFGMEVGVGATGKETFGKIRVASVEVEKKRQINVIITSIVTRFWSWLGIYFVVVVRLMILIVAESAEVGNSNCVQPTVYIVCVCVYVCMCVCVCVCVCVCACV